VIFALARFTLDDELLASLLHLSNEFVDVWFRVRQIGARIGPNMRSVCRGRAEPSWPRLS